MLYRRRLGTAGAVVAGLLQATSLPFLVTAAQIGTVTGRLSTTTAAALVCAGLLSVLIFPAAALGLLARAPSVAATPGLAPSETAHAEATGLPEQA